MVLQLFAQWRWDGCDDQSYSPVRVGSDKLEDNDHGKQKINSNSPSNFRSHSNTILVGAPKTTRQYNLNAWQHFVSKIITSEASPKQIPSSHHVRIEHVSDRCKMSGLCLRATDRYNDVTALSVFQTIWKPDIHSLYSQIFYIITKYIVPLHPVLVKTLETFCKCTLNFMVPRIW